MKNSDAPEGLDPKPGAGAATGPVAAGEARRLDARDLMQGAREIILTLDGEAYRLRITARQKLILTK